MTRIVFRQHVGVAAEGLERLGQGALRRGFALLGIVVRTNGRPVRKRREHVVRAVGVHAELCGDVRGKHATLALDDAEAGGQEIVVRALHAADARVAAEQNGRDAKLRAVRAGLPRDVVAARHAQIELRHAHAAGASREEVAPLVQEHEKRQYDHAPEHRGHDAHQRHVPSR